MKIRCWYILLFFLIYMTAPLAMAQKAQPENEKDSRMVLAYAFYLKQKMSLEFISGRFPRLRDYIESTVSEWDREFLPSVATIDSTLTSSLKDEWAKNKNELYEKYIRADYSSVTETDAKQFIDEVNDRTFGHIQSPILETFLIWNPQYRKYPEKEFTDGYVSNYTTRSKPTSSPVNIKIVYPRSWKNEDGNKKANVVQNFVSDYGLGDLAFSLVVEKSKANYSKDKIAQALTQEAMLKTQPMAGKVLGFRSDITIDNCPAASITTYQEKEMEDSKKLCLIHETYTTLYKNFKISLRFVITSEKAEDINDTYQKYQKLMKRIVDNTVILSQWGQ